MAILALPAPRLTSHEMKVSIRSALSELGDVTNPNWPSPETLKRYDDMNRSDFWRSRGASPEAVALLSLGGIDDRVETRSALFILRNQALNQQLTRYYKIRGGTDLLPRAFASHLLPVSTPRCGLMAGCRGHSSRGHAWRARSIRGSELVRSKGRDSNA